MVNFLEENTDIFTSPTMTEPDTERLQKELEERRAATKQAAQQAEEMRIRNEMEEEALKQKEWDLAIEQLKNEREEMSAQYAKRMEDMRKLAEETSIPQKDAIHWLREQLEKLGAPKDPGAEQLEKDSRESGSRSS